MKRVIGVKYKLLGVIEDFEIGSEDSYTIGKRVKVQAEDGVWLGKVMTIPKEIDETKTEHDIYPVIGNLELEDLRTFRDNRIESRNVFEICYDIIHELGIKMKLIDVEYNLDRSKAIFYYTADGRIDFRELVKKLAFRFKTRIEMKQIGVRDEAKIRGGHGICGQHLCCNRFLQNFETVTIRNAKDQNLNINTAKISGVCGRLMCCLRYELDYYKEFLGEIPSVGTEIEYLGKKVKISGFNAIKHCITIQTQEGITKDIDLSRLIRDKNGNIIVEEEEYSAFPKENPGF